VLLLLCVGTESLTGSAFLVSVVFWQEKNIMEIHSIKACAIFIVLIKSKMLVKAKSDTADIQFVLRLF
tara:strand:- start:7783 stop:7986 length:204 start_codon:yes stop_codon:yes gene_type:complete